MSSPRLKHLPLEEWPEEDRALFAAAFAPGDIFDPSRGAGAHLSAGSRYTITMGYRRWLGFLAEKHPDDLALPAADRVTLDRVRDYVADLGMRETSIATMVAQLYNSVRFIAPDRDWRWLKALKARLQARSCPEDRFGRLVPGHLTLDHGIALMDAALASASDRSKHREIQFRDGFIMVLLSLFPVRRRSLAALRCSHIEVGDGRIEILLHPEDTKAGRAESCPVPAALHAYLHRYLNEIRPILMGRHDHDALWVGQRGNMLWPGSIYDAIRSRTESAFGKAMALHDFRRSAATGLATDAPEKVGLIPGILQHVSAETGDRYYNLARSTMASRRHSATIRDLRVRLRQSRGTL